MLKDQLINPCLAESTVSWGENQALLGTLKGSSLG